MTALKDLTDAHVILLAAQLAAEGQINSLRGVVSQRPSALRPETVYRVLLTYLAQDVLIDELILLFQDLQNSVRKLSQTSTDVTSFEFPVLNLKDARERVRRLILQPLPDWDGIPHSELLSRYLVTRAHQLEYLNDELLSFFQCITPFLEETHSLREWVVSKLLPLLRLKYEYYPGSNISLSLQDLDVLQGQTGVHALLRNAERDSRKAEVGRDLRGVVAPWIYGASGSKRRKLSMTGDLSGIQVMANWQDVNEWIFMTSLKDFSLAERAIMEWSGPNDIDMGGFEKLNPGRLPEDELRYAQTGLALIYAVEKHSEDTITGYQRILERVSQRTGIKPPKSADLNYSSFPLSLTQISKASLFINALLHPGNVLTRPSSESTAFLTALIESLGRIRRLSSTLSIREAAHLTLFGTEEQQSQELKRLLQQISPSANSLPDWISARDNILWLWSWTQENRNLPPVQPGRERRALLWRLSVEKVETEFLGVMLSANQYESAVHLYITSSGPLSLSDVEKCVQDAIFVAYDNASNGNRTRGGMKRAYDMLKAFQPHFKGSPSFREIERLIAATHSLSFYHLTLQHGIPFQPVSIRVHKDPISLIGKVLEQNQRAYTKLDDLLSIGRNFVEAGLPVSRTPSRGSENPDPKLFDVEHRITYLAITSALSIDDFDTAYSYITTRLSQPSNQLATFTDDTSWRAAYAAGRYEPTVRAPINMHGLTFEIARLHRRMELLSLALMLSPTPEPLPEILETWRDCEALMEDYKLQEIGEERAAAEGVANLGLVPGGFGGSEEERLVDIAETTRMADRRLTDKRSAGSWYNDEAPLTPFEVARGTLQKATSAWRGPRTDTLASPITAPFVANNRANLTAPSVSSIRAWDQNQNHKAGMEELVSPGTNSIKGGSSDEQARIRKRDMVGNMIAGGVVSGLGWVLGAQPTKERPDDDDDI